MKTIYERPSAENKYSWVIKTKLPSGEEVTTNCKALYNSQRHYLVKMTNHMNKVVKALNGFDEERIDIIGQNGNTGEHYGD